MLIVEMATAEQQRCLHHDDNSGSRLAPVMPTRKPRGVKIMEGGYCPDTRYEKEKGAQHKALEEALKDHRSGYHHGYNVTTLPIIIGQSGSHYHTTYDALARMGLHHGPASKVMSKLHEFSVLT